MPAGSFHLQTKMIIFEKSQEMSVRRSNFPVRGMGCAACVARVQNTLKEQKGVIDASVSLASNSARVDYDPQVVTPEGLKKAVQDAGYDLLVDGGEGDEADSAEAEAERLRQDEFLSLRKDALLSAVLAALIMIVGMGFKPFPSKGWVLCLLAAPAVFWCGRRFIRNAWNQARHWSSNMDTLVALSTVISFLFSLFNLIFPSVWTSRGLEPRLYFESSAMIVAFILIGRVLEERAKFSTTASIRGLMGLRPRAIDIAVGESVTVNPGDRIPVDGEVVSGEARVDESMLTGESDAALKVAGTKVYTGTINLGGTILVRAEKTGKDTMLSSMIRMVKDAQGSKARIQNLVDRIAAVFVPAIIVISLVALACWVVFSPEDGLTRGLLAMVTVLVVACPCSLGLATPTALIAGIGKGAEKGILIKDADSLQVAGKTDCVVLDKTGTLTVTDGVGESIRPGSAEAVAALKKMGMEVYMESGDKEEKAARVAGEVGISKFKSGCLPADKAQLVKDLQAEGKKVAMAGDGINDSAALALADLSVAMGSGTDIAMNTAMVTIVSSDLRKLPELIKLSRRTVKIIRENLVWAFLYNVIAVPVAAGIFYPISGFVLNPMVAAACMAASSVLVVCNSLRLRYL